MTTFIRFGTILFAAALGAALPLLNRPYELLLVAPVALLFTAMFVYYRAAWRQGHSGIAVIPVVRGPLGLSGLTLRLSASERVAISAIAAFFVGLACAIGALVIRS